MQYEIILSRNGYKQVLRIIKERLKNWQVWKVKFQDGAEAVLFKCGEEWLQRNEDNLDRTLLKAIGEQIDQLNGRISYS